MQAKDGEIDVHTRMFAPEHGIPEDPATGAANVALIGVLAHHRPEADITLAKTIGQGFDMGRPSVLQASCGEEGRQGRRDLHRRPLQADDERCDRAGMNCQGPSLRSG